MEYKGTKFKTILEQKQIPETNFAKNLTHWGKILSDSGFIPHYENKDVPERKSSAGNLSCRTEKGFLITASYSDLENLGPVDFVQVTDVDFKQKIVYAKGLRNPSSESMMHFAIYQKRKGVNAIFHGHFNELLRNYSQLGLVSTKRYEEYGTLELVDSILKVLRKNNFLILKKHGFLSLSKNINQAGEIVMKINNKLRNSSRLRVDKKE